MIKGFLLSREILSEDEAVSWISEFDELKRKGEYFFCSAPVVTEALKVP